MKRLFFDTNIILDILLKREPYCQEAIRLVDYADENNIDISISATSVTNAMYVAQKSKFDTDNAINIILNLFNILDTTDYNIRHAATLKWKDYEDAVQYSVACTNSSDYLITRDLKHFNDEGNISVMTPVEFLESVGVM